MNISSSYHREVRRRKRTDRPGIYQLNDECSPVIKGHLETLREVQVFRHSVTCSRYYRGNKNQERKLPENKIKHILVLLENSLILLEENNEIIITQEGVQLLEEHNIF